MAPLIKTSVGSRYRIEKAELQGPEARIETPKVKRGPRIARPYESVDVALDELEAAVRNRVPAWCPKCREWRYFDRERLTRGQKRLPV